MNEKLRLYVEELFKEAPKTKQTIEIKEEILQNTIDRYNDLIAEGKTEEAAYNISVAGIGDVSRLLADITPIESPQYTSEEIEKNAKKRSILLSISVMLYILSIVPVIFLDETRFSETLSPAIMFIIIAIATGLIIYRSGISLKYNKSDGTVVEDFKEWKRETQEKNTVLKAINIAIWVITLAVYFTVSFITGAWHISWLIFPIGGFIDGMVNGIFDLLK